MPTKNKTVKIKCPFCEKRDTRVNLITHIEDEHEDELPEGFTAMRYLFNYINKHPIDYHGKCIICKGPTDWDENKGRYNIVCNNKSCKDAYQKMIKERLYAPRDSEALEKALENRRISGKYRFKNGVEKPYVGKYEKECLKFMDQVMDINPDDISAPGPIIDYEFEGKMHHYITDFLYEPYNLIIEVKDGGDNPNNRNMKEYRAKQIAKENEIIKNTNYNYIRLTNNDFSQLLAVFMDIKLQLVDNTNDRVVHINEAMNALLTGYMPGTESNDSVYISKMNLANTVFSGDDINSFSDSVFGVSNNAKLDNVVWRNESTGLLEIADNIKDITDDYTLYEVKIDPQYVSDQLYPYLGKEVSRGFIYETIFNKTLYTSDQIELEDTAIKTLSTDQYMKEIFIPDVNRTINDIAETESSKVDKIVKESYDILSSIMK